MRWRTGRDSDNVEDRRSGGGFSGGSGAKIGGFGLLAMVVVGLLMGEDPIKLLSMAGSEMLNSGSSTTSTQTPANDENAQFVSKVLASTEDVWMPQFKQLGGRYIPPKLVLFTDGVDTACGFSESATGPFYCPSDSKVYIDLGFFNELGRMGVNGDFARAYVIAHEVGHHVQNQLGTSEKITRLQQQVNTIDANQLSVLLELQADCYAGVWANHAQQQYNILESGDIEKGLNAAASIGDDRLQRMAGQRINPDGFTHGTSQQRVQWFKTGLQYGDIRRCDTFAGLKIR